MESTKKVIDILDQAREQGISVFLDDSKLRLKVAKGKKVDPEFVGFLRENKQEITDFLTNEMGDFKKINTLDKKIVPFDRSAYDRIPLSFAQQRLWFIDQFQGSTQYHISQTLRLTGAFSLADLEASLKEIVNRHEVLRTVIREEEGEAYQLVLPVDDWKVTLIEDIDFEDHQSFINYIETLIETPFDLSNDYTLRVHLVKLDEEEYEFVVVMHHIASDGWSMSIVIDELGELYTAKQEGRPAELPELNIQYTDFAVWERNYLSGERLKVQLDYWKKKLADTAVLDLPVDFLRPTVKSTAGDALVVTLPKELSQRARDFSKEQGVTLFMTLLSAFKILLYRYSGQDDICVGCPIARRTEGETENLIGFFINMLAMRTNFSGNPTFVDLLKQVKQTTLDGYANQDAPFEQVVEMHSVGRDVASSPIFQVSFVLNNTPESESEGIGSLQLESEAIETKNSTFELSFDMDDSPSGLTIMLQYCTDLFKHDTIVRMTQHFEQILRTFLANPQVRVDDIPILLKEERALILGLKPTKEGDWFNEGAKDLGNNDPINLRFETVAAAHPADIAVSYGDENWSYEKLNLRANQIGHCLQSIGVQPGDFVGVYMDRSPILLSSLLGIIKCGAVYVPLDTQNPADRIEKIISNNDLKVVMSTATLLSGLETIDAAAVIAVDTCPTSLKTKLAKDGALIVKDISSIDAAATTNIPNQNDLRSWAYVLFTSGSTGQPKGAITRHDGAMNHILAEYEAMELADGFKFLQSAGIGSDISMWQLLAPILKGGTVVIIDKHDLLDYNFVAALIEKENIDLVEFVPSYTWGMINHIQNLAVAPSLTGLKWIMLSGEEAPVGLVNDWKKHYPTIRILNGYGPCEASDDITQYEVAEVLASNTNRVPIGRPIPNMNVFVVDVKTGKLCPIGIPGELCVSGVGVGAGYLGMPEKTAESFIPNPFAGTLGDTLYKTGDLAKWLPDGNLDFLGRIDRQVKIRGNRVELGEIEALVRQENRVKEAHIIVYEKTALVAFIVLTPAALTGDKGTVQTALKAAIIELCESGLPSYMRPDHYCFIDRMPVNLSDKVDQKKLIAHYEQQENGTLVNKTLVPCRTETEKAVLTIWKEVLELEQIGADEDFFEIGGHSLLAMRIKAAVRKQLEVEVEIKHLFLHKTIRSLAKFIDTVAKGILLPEVTAQPRPERIPLSFSQERLWFIDRLEGSSHYHVPIILRFGDEMDIDTLEYAFNEIISRHEVLRTTYKDIDGVAYQDILPENEWKLAYQDLSFETNAWNEDQLNELITTEINKPFDLADDYVFRAKLVKLSEAAQVLIIVLHHIAYDGWSEAIIIQELKELYQAKQENRPSTLSPLSIQYADYAIWQRTYLQGEVLENMLDYWETQLKDTEVLHLPIDFPRPPIQSTNGVRLVYQLDNELRTALVDLAQREDATLFMVLLAGFKVLLYHYTGQEDICIGSASANRGQAELEALVGFFINTLALRSDLSGNPSFANFLAQIKETTLDAYTHQDVPLEKIVDRVVKTRDLSRTPLFQTLFMLQNTPEEEAGAFEGADTEEEEEADGFSYDVAKFDLTFSLEEEEDGLALGVVYCSDLFLPSTIERMVAHYQVLLRSIIKDVQTPIGQLNILTETEEKELSTVLNQNQIDFPKDKTVVALFEAQAAKYPEQHALVFEGNAITYQQLNEKANQLANYLQAQGVQRNELVGVCLKAPMDHMVLAILGILKAGAAYVPIDPELPQDRINYIIADISATFVLTNESGASLFAKQEKVNLVLLDEEWSTIAKAATTKPTISLKGDDLVYVIYTSGSTGKPKGVLLTHENLSDYIFGLTDKIDLTNCKSYGLMSTMSADLGNTVLYAALTTGACLHLFTKETLTDAIAIQEYFKVNPIDCIKIVPSHWQALAVDQDLLLPQRMIIFGGEELSTNIVAKIKAAKSDISLVNHYGPTETTIGKLLHQVDFERDYIHIPIGLPFSNTSTYVVNQNLSLCPIGIPGELLIGGMGVARGYVNLPAQTSKSFIADPFSKAENARVYRTGDLVVRLADGSIVFKGRIDSQVKIRGFRIELGEIEAALKNSPLVSQNVVLAKTDANGNKRLVAYIVPAGEFDKDAIQLYLKNQVPDYMIPAIMMEISEMPLTANGKVNRKALPEPDIASLITSAYLAPSSETETKLVTIWKELLNLEAVGINDNFFELGGDSITSIQAVSRAKRMGLQLKPRDLFLHQTIAELAVVVEQQAFNIETEQGLLTGTSALAPIQQWFFEKPYDQVDYYNQAVLLEIDKTIDATQLETVMKALVAHHDALRFVYQKEASGWTQTYGDQEGKLYTEDLTQLPATTTLENAIEKTCGTYQKALSLEKGDLMRTVLLKTPTSEKKNRLFMVIHHLAVDGVAWRIILDDITRALTALLAGEAIDLGEKGSSYRQWVNALQNYATSKAAEAQLPYWKNTVADYRSLSIDRPENAATVSYAKDLQQVSIELNEDLTNALLKEVNKAYKTEINDILLSTLAQTIAEWSNYRKVVIGLEGHGREEISASIDINDTLGWFTNIYPVSLLAVAGNLSEDNIGNLLKSVKEQLRAVPEKGMAYGALKYLHPTTAVKAQLQGGNWDIVFNYLGQFDNVVDKEGLLDVADESFGENSGERYPAAAKLEVSGAISAGKLNISWTYSTQEYHAATIERLANEYKKNLSNIIAHCLGKEDIEFTPSDYGLDGKVSVEELDELMGVNEVEGDEILKF